MFVVESITTKPFLRKEKTEWKVIFKETGDVLGSYRDYHYAKNRAKYKFKKYMRAVERLLISTA